MSWTIPLPFGSSGGDQDPDFDVNIQLTFHRKRPAPAVTPEGRREAPQASSQRDAGESCQGPFQRFKTYVQLDFPHNPPTIGTRFKCNGHIFRIVRIVQNASNRNLMVLECVQSTCPNSFSFLVDEEIYIFGQHQHLRPILGEHQHFRPDA
jgi:hypothetical protein